ncbi:aminotransferase class V-fold PLP-dependent enzyme, partial [Candidatus Bathyarchaeota archaeon]|nr:aminotransferase class V-fold PLP-dependent enzyme [Candidatus Bathyarchaeota archaeon]
MSGRRVYMDYGASKPVDTRVQEAMAPYLRDSFGNPSSTHSLGQEAQRVLEDSRAKVAALINAKPSEIVFTSGAT